MSPTALALAPLLAVSACAPSRDCTAVIDADDQAEREVGAVRLVRTVLDNATCGPAYAAAGDLDGDGLMDLVIAALGPRPDGGVPPGSLRTWLQRDGSFSASDLIAPEDGIRFPNQPTLHDLDGDGDLDLVQPLGFFPCSFELFGTPCGGMIRFDNDGSGAFRRTDLIAPGDPTFHHGVAVADLDGDGNPDLVTVAERRDAPWDAGTAELAWLRGLGGGRFAEKLERRGAGLSTFPSVADIDGDGDLDVAGAEFLGADRASFAWMENRGDGDFRRHVISDAHGPGFGLQLTSDLRPDGHLVALGTNHTNPVRKNEDPASALVLFEPGDEPTAPWRSTVLLDNLVPEDRSGQFAPGLFGTGDIDADGLVDVVVSGDGDPRVFVLLQRDDGSFSVSVLEEDLGQAGGMLIVDLDGDGRNEMVVTGYEDNVVFVYHAA